VRLTGRKAEQKRYYRHSGYPGSVRSQTAAEVLGSIHPERVVQHAVRGMLPKNALGRKLYRKLKVYAGPDHPHQAQKPEEIIVG
jgi:large subunit ribosomal protein L13